MNRKTLLSVAAKLNRLTGLLLATFCMALSGLPAFAQAAATAPAADELRAVLEMVRSDISSLKTRALNKTMELTTAEAEKFWPIYRQYEKELASVADQKLALLREFSDRLDRHTLDNPASDRLAKQWLKINQARLDLWRKYQKKVAKALSPARAVQFLQVEHQMSLFVDLNIASEMPALRMVTKPANP